MYFPPTSNRAEFLLDLQRHGPNSLTSFFNDSWMFSIKVRGNWLKEQHGQHHYTSNVIGFATEVLELFLDQKPPWSNPALIISYQLYPFPKPSPNQRVFLLRSYLPGYFFFFLTSWRANLLITSKRSSSWEACFCVFFFF